MATMIKISATGEQLLADAPEWDAVLLPEQGLMFSAGNASQKELNEKEANEACAALTLAGFNDWRVPTRQELESILDLSRYSPAIDTTHFRDTKNDWYRTSTPCPWSSDRAWLVGFDYGGVYDGNRRYRAFVRAVRRVSPATATKFEEQR